MPSGDVRKLSQEINGRRTGPSTARDGSEAYVRYMNVYAHNCKRAGPERPADMPTAASAGAAQIALRNDPLERFGVAADAVQEGAVPLIGQQRDDLARRRDAGDRIAAMAKPEPLADVIAMRRLGLHRTGRAAQGGVDDERICRVGFDRLRRQRSLAAAGGGIGRNGDRSGSHGKVLLLELRRVEHNGIARGTYRVPDSTTHGSLAGTYFHRIAAAAAGAHTAASAFGAANPKAPVMPVDPSAAPRPTVPLPHRRKLAFAGGALFAGLALYAARLIFG